jgi:flagellar motor switch protein FliN
VRNLETFIGPDTGLQPTVVEFADIGPDDRRGSTLISSGLDVVKNVMVNIQVLAGYTTVSIGDLLALQEGQLIRLESLLDAPMQIMLEGQAVASGQLMALGDHFAIRIVDTVQRT